ncbi:MAG: sensor histidine kinase [Desulfobulbaceae bacterium]|nr:sensor histidine kinase [Desulfobulbaceae bacterium]
MTTDECVEALSKVDLFAHFTKAEIENFVLNAEEICCAPGEVLIEEGTVAEDFFILLSGKLSVFKGKRILSELTAVDCVGEMAIIESRPRSATVKAFEKSSLLRISSESFQEFLLQRKDSLFSLMKILSHRIRMDNEVIAHDFEQTSILVHDMRNLLSLFLLLDKFEMEKGSVQDKHIRIMKTARGHLARLANLCLANVKKNVIPENYGLNSLPSLLMEMAESDCITHPDLCDKKITIKETSPLPEFQFSKLQIRRVLLNLLINASQASASGGSIEVVVERQDGSAVVQIKDHGSGVSDSIGARIFDSYYTTKPQGNGLGLSSCKQIVEQNHGGCLSFAANPSGGTIFTVSLPLLWRESSDRKKRIPSIPMSI